MKETKGKLNRYPLGILELREGRLFVKHNMGGATVEVDVTPVWHFFKEVSEFEKNPRPLND